MLAARSKFGGSSSGRTADSDSVNLGSNPSPPATSQANSSLNRHPSPALPFRSRLSERCTPCATSCRCGIDVNPGLPARRPRRSRRELSVALFCFVFGRRIHRFVSLRSTSAVERNRLFRLVSSSVKRHLRRPVPPSGLKWRAPASVCSDAKKQHILGVCLFLPHSVAKHSAFHYSSVRKA